MSHIITLKPGQLPAMTQETILIEDADLPPFRPLLINNSNFNPETPLVTGLKFIKAVDHVSTRREKFVVEHWGATCTDVAGDVETYFFKNVHYNEQGWPVCHQLLLKGVENILTKIANAPARIGITLMDYLHRESLVNDDLLVFDRESNPSRLSLAQLVHGICDNQWRLMDTIVEESMYPETLDQYHALMFSDNPSYLAIEDTVAKMLIPEVGPTEALYKYNGCPFHFDSFTPRKFEDLVYDMVEVFDHPFMRANKESISDIHEGIDGHTGTMITGGRLSARLYFLLMNMPVTDLKLRYILDFEGHPKDVSFEGLSRYNTKMQLAEKDALTGHNLAAAVTENLQSGSCYPAPPGAEIEFIKTYEEDVYLTVTMRNGDDEKALRRHYDLKLYSLVSPVMTLL